MSHNIVNSLFNTIIPFQPLQFHSPDEPVERCPCTTERYQQTYFQGDDIRAQFKSYPIGDDLFPITGYNYGTNWTNAYYGNCHVAGAAGDLRVLAVLNSGSHYVVTITVEDYEGGILTVKLGTEIIGFIESEGQYQYDGKANGANLVMSADADFVGCVDVDSIFELCADFDVLVYPNGIIEEPVEDDKEPITSYPLTDQYGKAVFLMDQEFDNTITDFPLDGCIVLVLESCNSITNGTFAGNINGWTADAGWAYNTGTAAWDNNLAGGTLSQSDVFNEGHKYHIKLTVSDYLSGTLTVTIGAFTYDITANGTYEFWVDVPNGVTDLLLVATIGRFRVDNISAKMIEGYTNAIKVIDVPADPCTYKLLEWRNDEDAYGFNYSALLSRNFYFVLRLEAEIEFRSNYDEDVEDYTDGAGKTTLTYAQLRKIRNLSTERVNGDILDALFAMRRHDEILIDGSRYVVPKDNGLDPDYQNKAEVASVTIQMARPDQDLFNSLC